MSSEERAVEAGAAAPAPSPLREIVQPFVDVVRAPRALWGVNLAYLIEGMVYFGILGYLAIHFSDFIFRGVPHADEWSHSMVMVLTAGITISMLFLGFVGDKWGVRRALLLAFSFLLVGRVVISAAPTVMGLQPAGLWSPLHLVTMGGILLVVIGYGMYQPAAYAAVRQFTTPKTAAMGFAMLYALMNLGGYIPTYAFLLRDEDFLGLGIPGTFWVYTAFTAVGLVATMVLLSRKTVAGAIAAAKRERAAAEAEEQAKASDTPVEDEVTSPVKAVAAPATVPWHVWLVLAAILGMVLWRVPRPWSLVVDGVLLLAVGGVALLPKASRGKVVGFITRHPLADAKFFVFIFALIPVQTLFTYNWLVLPQYISRAYEGWIGEYFEFAANLNPILVFILVPIITAATRNAPVYRMMIIGTTIMAAPAFLLGVGPFAWALFGYILIMTVGEAIWQPRFLQYAAEIAPEGRTGEYMGVAQLPWFLTKVLVPLLYSGFMMDTFCPDVDRMVRWWLPGSWRGYLRETMLQTETMWLVFGLIAITSPVALVLARNWLGKGMKLRG